MGLLVVGIGALQFVLDKGQQEDWFASTMITTLAIISAVGLIALIVQQLHVEGADHRSAPVHRSHATRSACS